jgi:putative pyruvate formate lyase activating enzyme
MLYAIVRAVEIAAGRGLSLPIVYNTGGYDNPEVLSLIRGVADIYMPDIKYADSETASSLSGAEDYPEVVKAAVREMHNQVGDLVLDEKRIARRGLLIRHLVLPNGLSQSNRVLDFIASLSKNTYVNIMDQYHPVFRADEYVELRRRVTHAEFSDVVEYAKQIGLHRLYT